MATVPGTHTFVNGIRDSSEENTYLRDPLLFLLKRPMARLRQIVTQSLTTGVAAPITFTQSDVDQDYAGGTGHSNSVNGTVANGVESMGPAVAALFQGAPARTELIYLSVGDYVELWAFQSSGGALSTAVAATGPASVMDVVWMSN